MRKRWIYEKSLWSSTAYEFFGKCMFGNNFLKHVYAFDCGAILNMRYTKCVSLVIGQSHRKIRKPPGSIRQLWSHQRLLLVGLIYKAIILASVYGQSIGNLSYLWYKLHKTVQYDAKSIFILQYYLIFPGSPGVFQEIQTK